METQSLKTLAHKVLSGNIEGNTQKHSSEKNVSWRGKKKEGRKHFVSTQKWSVEHIKKTPKLPPSICAALDFLDRVGWERGITPKMGDWIDSDREVLRYEKELER